MPSAPSLGGSKRAIELDATAFEARFNGPLVHESVRAELAARRRGTAATRTRGRVSGGGAKPWRQKGTGRARAGSSRSPVWTGGGTVFGPHPRSYTVKVNRKERRAALRSALSLHAARGSLAILDADSFKEPSTRTAAALLAGWAQPRPTLVVVSADERAAALSFRNIDRVSVLVASSVGVADLVGAASLLCSESALAELTSRAATSAQGDSAQQTAPVEPARATKPAKTQAAPAASTAPAPKAVAAPAASTVPAPKPAAAVKPKPAAVVKQPKPAAAAKPKPAAVVKPKPAAAMTQPKPAAAVKQPKPAAVVKPKPAAVVKPKPAAEKAAPKPKPAPRATRARKPTTET